MIESICLMHFIGAGILVGLFFLVGRIIKPESIVPPMSPVEESQYDLIHQDEKNRVMAVQLKENVTHGKRNEQETLVTSH